jgi:hypothetical protein
MPRLYVSYANSTAVRNGSGILQQIMPMIRPFRLTEYARQLGNHVSLIICSLSSAHGTEQVPCQARESPTQTEALCIFRRECRNAQQPECYNMRQKCRCGEK